MLSRPEGCPDLVDTHRVVRFTISWTRSPWELELEATYRRMRDDNYPDVTAGRDHHPESMRCSPSTG